MDSPDSTEFRQPVDYVGIHQISNKIGLGLEDYQKIVENPMDLGTLFKKLSANKYKTVENCLEDIQLIWDNCK